MNFSSILAKAKRSENLCLNVNKDKSIDLITNEVFYIEPAFRQITHSVDANIIIFSAPGASGKSALSKK